MIILSGTSYEWAHWISKVLRSQLVFQDVRVAEVANNTVPSGGSGDTETSRSDIVGSR